MKLRIFLFMILAALVAAGIEAKPKPKWGKKFPDTKVVVQRVNKQGYVVKSWAIEGNADKAIKQARENVIIQLLFFGAQPSPESRGAATLPAILDTDIYFENFEMLDELFKNGRLLNFATPISDIYPTGEDNQKVSGGRRVGVEYTVNYEGLRDLMVKKGLVKTMDSVF